MQYNNAKYLLQVWDKTYGKAYEKPLKCTFKYYERFISRSSLNLFLLELLDIQTWS